jgi:hypothetical protein
MMHKNIGLTGAVNKAIAFLRVKPFDNSLCHEVLLKYPDLSVEYLTDRFIQIYVLRR